MRVRVERSAVDVVPLSPGADLGNAAEEVGGQLFGEHESAQFDAGCWREVLEVGGDHFLVHRNAEYADAREPLLLERLLDEHASPEARSGIAAGVVHRFDKGLRLPLFKRLDARATRVEDLAGGPVGGASMIPALAAQVELMRVVVGQRRSRSVGHSRKGGALRNCRRAEFRVGWTPG
ncbi:hypothetical protein [Variovorax ginsengisoli]|uniref:Uncharacterized protein n=1 Tax=Variovorax ginsengisoli TaxID=363844 RepID=A0ABT8SDB3_9BURK|nr:hypothetical protein [Variovorax ginsengisoli]MDN8617159.1 hypothetical protein [Variovorax ginsengisoli]MDO1536329.1 hypothetical protein [Variovorax ginsengisoli]